MSQPSSNFTDFGAEVTEQPNDPRMDFAPPAPMYRKQGFSIYSVMLIMSFVFLAIASILLYVNVGKYN